ncbi:hypothetical protein FA13DRAFT_1724748 [Coprinellus micaceus]|uniref:Uncharacterized protein n=1 Tax=Coprinellus micaceus TaxID=71717 RepID=A0A4Y7TXA5_COPMI|nr:hypothetical protein FA13DRAFT_1724748 [Coprinellus micaceus]
MAGETNALGWWLRKEGWIEIFLRSTAFIFDFTELGDRVGLENTMRLNSRYERSQGGCRMDGP